MDAITAAIVLGVAGNFATEALKATYKVLKDALTAKYGEKSNLVDAVNKLESKPNSEPRKGLVQEAVEEVQADKDPELVKLAQDLLDKIKDQPDGIASIKQVISNVKYAATSGTGNATISQINDNAPSEEWKK